MSGMAHFFMSVGGSKFHERLAHFFIDIYILRGLSECENSGTIFMYYRREFFF